MLPIGLLLFLTATSSPAQQAESRVQSLLSRLSLEEKADLLAGVDGFYTRPVPRLGIPRLKMSDGPVGVRNYGPAVAYPAGACLAATFNVVLAERMGAALGDDARARGVHILLGPGVNIARVPQNGRNFEYFGEDPFLAGKLAAAYIRGVQSQGVVATVKHYAANNQEIERGTIDVRCDERTLREIYLPAFETAVKEGKVWAVMNAYNRLNGPYCTAHDWLNNQILKKEWGFQGLLMSDWGATHDAEGALLGGLDLEMPGPAVWKPDVVLRLVREGRVSERTIDDKVARLLRMAVSMGFLDRPQERSQTPASLQRNRQTALEVAREGIVLLKNQGGLLPLDRNRVRRVVVMGPNAHPAVSGGGGSSWTQPERSVSLLQGLSALLGESKVVRIQQPEERLDFSASLPVRDARAEIFAGIRPAGEPLATRQWDRIDFDWAGGGPLPDGPSDRFSARVTAKITPPSTGNYVLGAESDDGIVVRLDGETVIQDWNDHGAKRDARIVRLEAGRTYNLEIRYYENQGLATLRFGWWPEPKTHLTPAEERLVRGADAVVVAVGFGPQSEGEGWDRSYELPAAQVRTIREAARLNRNVVVVLNAGASVATDSWLSACRALLHAWYPGQEGGTALAEILLGVTNPSGKLPTSWERRLADVPAQRNYPGANGSVRYEEGLSVGYRFFDRSPVKPLYPFGFGLSYTRFEYSNLEVRRQGDRVLVRFTVRNSGGRAGKEAAQVYVMPPPGKVGRPVKVLRGVAKVSLRAGEAARVSVELDRRAFQRWDEQTKGWVQDPGTYTIWVGSSSVDRRLQAQLRLP
ncbi:MAG: glycoside hydrolase family 3 C-terminal domain-containing protein [Fimbriimonadales bacterium]